MNTYTKEEAINIVCTCATIYKKELAGKSLLFFCMDKHKKIFPFEANFRVKNFLHLTGIKTKLPAKDFFRRCLSHNLSPAEFEFAIDGTAQLKLNVLKTIISKILSASMFGIYLSSKAYLYTEYLIGNNKGCMGFVKRGDPVEYIPNTILFEDIRTISKPFYRIISIYRKDLDSKNNYSECVYKAKSIDWETIVYPVPYTYIKPSGGCDTKIF